AARAMGRRARGVSCDVTDRAQLEHLVEATMGEFGRIDLLVNNAGGFPPMSALDTDAPSWEWCLRFNLTSAFLLTRQCLPHMLARRRLGHGEGRRGRRRDGVDELAVRLSGGPTSSTTAQTNVVGPSQSPHASITLRAVPPAMAMAATIAARSSTPARASSSPVGEITAEMPVFVARICGRRVSMLRNAETTRWSCGPPPAANQESFDSVTIRSAPRRTAASANPGSTAS